MALLFAHTSHIGIIPIGARFIFAPMSHSTARRVRGAARAAVKKAGKLRVCSPVGVQIETWDETKIRNVEVVYLPTLGMAFNILDAPITTPETQSMGLCDVWRNRTLEPEWVFAVVCEMDFGAREGRVRVRDGGKDGMAQPSVLWYVGQQFMFLKHVLTLGGSLLLKGLLVKPTGTSFDLISTERTVCYCELCGVTEQASKRRRVHEPDYACQ